MFSKHAYENALLHKDYYEETFERLKGAINEETKKMFLEKIDYWDKEIEKQEKELMNGTT
jgi:hypothetical protein